MRMYWEFAKTSFQRHSIYRLQYFLGLLNSILMVFIGVSIWKAVYGNSQSIDGITENEIVTYAILGMIMRTMLTMNEFIIDQKVHSGEIAVDLLKPMRFIMYVFSMVLGEVGFNLWSKVLPVMVLVYFIFHPRVPENKIYLLYFVVSVILGYLVLYFLNCIFWLSAFWVHHTWSIVTIKNAFITILSGATIPIWFMPTSMSVIVQALPLKNIYFTPISIYLEKVSIQDVLIQFGEQVGWIVVLFTLVMIIWSKAQKKITVQGG